MDGEADESADQRGGADSPGGGGAIRVGVGDRDFGGLGAPSVKTDAGPPEKITALGAKDARNASVTVWKGWISQYTFSSRRRRAMSCVT